MDLSLSAEAFLNARQTMANSQAEEEVQDQAKATILKHFEDFYKDLSKLVPHLPNTLLFDEQFEIPDILWTARTLVLDDDSLQQLSIQHLLTNWLAETSRPDDAQQIITGRKSYSLTWLNYAINTPEPIGEDPHLQIMVLCQYYYVLQENCNSALRGAIESAYSVKRDNQIEKLLQRTRIACQLNQITYFEHIKFSLLDQVEHYSRIF